MIERQGIYFENCLVFVSFESLQRREKELSYMNYEQVARDVLAAVGGKENVSSVIHCVTRLRFKLRNRSIVDTDQVKQVNGVMTVVESGGQYQVVIGTEVPSVYQEVTKLIGESPVTVEETSEEKKSLFNRFISMITGIFMPTIGALAGAGILKGLLAMCVSFKWMTTEMGTYQILYAAADAFFYFFPILIGFSAGKRFGANPYITASIGAALVYPTMLTAFTEGTELSFLGIPVVLLNYTSSVFPIIAASWIAAKFERLLNSKLHASIKLFFTPLIVIVVVLPLTFLAIGPLVTQVSNLLAAVTNGAYNLSPLIAGIILGAFWQVIIIFGLHWGFIPLLINNITTLGFDPINALLFGPAMAQAGAALGVALKTREKSMKAVATSASISGIMGITEPAIYGVNLPTKKPFIMACIAGGIGGIFAGSMGAKAFGFGASGIFGIPLFINPEGFDAGFAGFLISIGISFFGAAILTYLFGFKDKEVKSSTKESTAHTGNVEVK